MGFRGAGFTHEALTILSFCDAPRRQWQPIRRSKQNVSCNTTGATCGGTLPENPRNREHHGDRGYASRQPVHTVNDAWSQGYVTGVGYTYGYHRETSPVFQRFCLLLRGLACDDPGEVAAHCELGFGQGVSVNINAAANPGQYVGTDFNPAHTAHAIDMARHAGGNLRLYDDSFEQLLARDDLPMFDSISLHGIWTWVSPENCRLITKFTARHLRPGGVLYVSYNCFPGWAPTHPLRQLFALHDRYVPGPPDIAQRIEAALKFSGAVLAANPRFARAVPGLHDRLQWISGQSRDYLAHEYFNRDWNCMYFSEVADVLAAAKLDFATTAAPLDVVDTVNLTETDIAFLNGIAHPILREQIRDYFVNQQFRKDLYQRGIRRLTPAELREQMLATRIVLERTIDAIPMTVIGGQGEAKLQDAIFRPLLDALAAQDCAPKSFGDLLQLLPGISFPQLTMAGAVLVGAGHAAPCQSATSVRLVREKCAALNQHLLERARTRDDVNYLASPVTGAGVAVGRFQQLFLLAHRGGCEQPADWAQFTWQLLTEHGHKLLKGDRPLATPEENLAELTAQANEFAVDRLPILRAVEIV
jgi:SAM-dependent methyltransferase